MAALGYQTTHTGAAPAVGLANNMGSADMSFTVTPSGNGYPTGAGGLLFVIAVDAGTVSEEKILCSARSGTSYTVQTGGRGYDNTVATTHSSGTTNVTHVWTATEANDTSDHIYNTTRDDHTQYALLTGGTQATFTGLLTASDALAVTGGVTTDTLTGTGAVTGNPVVATGLTGASAASRYVGATTSGAPTATDPFLTGDFVIDQTGAVWVCVASGSPGTWAEVGGQTDAAWTAPTLLNSWANKGGGYLAAGYRMIGGQVVLRGQVIGGTYPSVVFTLPTAYRPTGSLQSLTASDGTMLGVIQVDANGNVTAAAGVASHSISLSPCNFDTLA